MQRSPESNPRNHWLLSTQDQPFVFWTLAPTFPWHGSRLLFLSAIYVMAQSAGKPRALGQEGG